MILCSLLTREWYKMYELVRKIDLLYASSLLSNAAFKVLIIIRELAIRKKKQCLRNNQLFDGWISISYESLRQRSGVMHIRRVIQEFESNSEIIKVSKGNGIISSYRLNDDLLEMGVEK